jgi:hypothetical protein
MFNWADNSIRERGDKVPAHDVSLYPMMRNNCITKDTKRTSAGIGLSIIARELGLVLL